ncbi:MAG: ABC transporter permease [Dongiaceae bacterium]
MNEESNVVSPGTAPTDRSARPAPWGGGRAVLALRNNLQKPLRGIARRIARSRLLRAGIGVLSFWIVVAILAPWVTAYGPTAQDVGAIGKFAPSAAHVLGTDLAGRDIWSRLAFGARIVLILAPGSLLVAYCVGGAMGLLSGYFGGWLDVLLSRASDVVLAFPVIVIYILLITSIGASAFNIVVAVTLSTAPAVARIVRGLVLDVKSRDFVRAARVRGESDVYIMLVEILPNLRATLTVDLCLRMSYTIIKIGILGFLGLGLPPPTPEWGGMVKDAASVLLVWPHMALFPCLAISSLAIAFNLIADGLNETAR